MTAASREVYRINSMDDWWRNNMHFIRLSRRGLWHAGKVTNRNPYDYGRRSRDVHEQRGRLERQWQDDDITITAASRKYGDRHDRRKNTTRGTLKKCADYPTQTWPDATHARRLDPIVNKRQTFQFQRFSPLATWTESTGCAMRCLADRLPSGVIKTAASSNKMYHNIGFPTNIANNLSILCLALATADIFVEGQRYHLAPR